ncbi:hypothetical protein HZS_3646 [Henneguya salminicola]|nr:hypothetical protein HZS_3646 [Henneguya salminicola]
MVETVDSIDIASAINNELLRRDLINSLNILLQVNTSGESNKSGCSPESVKDIAQYIVNSCKKLKLVGVMTIGSISDSLNDNDIEFKKLKICCEQLKNDNLIIDEEPVISMGMSNDYEKAYKCTNWNKNIRCKKRTNILLKYFSTEDSILKLLLHKTAIASLYIINIFQ